MRVTNARALIEAVLTFTLGFSLPSVVLPYVLLSLGYGELKLLIEFNYIGSVPSILIEGLYSYVFIGSLIASSSGAIYMLLRHNVRTSKDFKKELLEFLSLTIAHVSSGSTLFEALKRVTPEVREPTLKNYLGLFSGMVSLGEDPEDVLNKPALRKTPKEVRLVLAALSVAFKSGGAYMDVLKQTNEYLTQLLRLDMLRRSRLSEYKLVVTLSIIAYALSAVVTAGLLTSMLTSSNVLVGGGELIKVNVVKSAYYVSSIALASIASIIVSKVIEDNLLKTFKYIALLSSLVTAIYVVSELITL